MDVDLPTQRHVVSGGSRVWGTLRSATCSAIGKAIANCKLCFESFPIDIKYAPPPLENLIGGFCYMRMRVP